MPRNSENQHVEATPHFDGEKDSIINDPTATASDKIGIFIPTEQLGEFGMEKNPYNFTPKADPMMQRFERLMRGTKKT